MSVVAGLDKGVRMLSTVNIYVAAVFMVFVLVMCYSLYRGLEEEYYHLAIIEKIQPETQQFEMPTHPHLLEKTPADADNPEPKDTT